MRFKDASFGEALRKQSRLKTLWEVDVEKEVRPLPAAAKAMSSSVTSVSLVCPVIIIIER